MSNFIIFRIIMDCFLAAGIDLIIWFVFLDFSNNTNINRLLLNDILFTNSINIKSLIQQYFQNYFSKQPLPSILPNSEFYILY